MLEHPTFYNLIQQLRSAAPDLFQIRISSNDECKAEILDSETNTLYESAVIFFGLTKAPRWGNKDASAYITVGLSGNKARFFCNKSEGWNVPAIAEEIRTRVLQERHALSIAAAAAGRDSGMRELIWRLDYPHISPSHIEDRVLFKFAENVTVEQAERLVDFLKSEGLA